MSALTRHNVHVAGVGTGPTMVFAHGFGCDQNMWRLLVPHFAERFRVVTFDQAGAGNADPSAWDRKRHATLGGYADDVLAILDEVADAPVLFVGHSVGAMVGMLAGLKAPERFAGHLMVGPSPCYVNDGDYVGGFTREDIAGLLQMLEANYLGWSSTMAPAIMGAPDQPELGAELTDSFCRTDPEIAKQFARVTFLSDNRADLPRVTTPTLIIQSHEDIIAPLVVGEYLHAQLPGSMLRVVDNVGHCPHLSAPSASADAMDEFLATLGH